MDDWKHIATDESILDDIRQCGYFDFDGSIDKLHSKFCDTIKNREVPYELLEEVNDFIDEMKSIAEDDEIDEDEASYDGELDENLV